jgi:hypothetical protein
MPIPFTCPHCGRTTEVAEQYAGRSGPCARCGQTITVPGLASGPGTPFQPGYAPVRRSGMPAWAIVLIVLACLVPVGGILLGLLLPAVNAAREAARRSVSMNNLHQIGMGMQNYASSYGNKFPSRASFDQQGRPLLSWRVHLLPFLEQQALYQQFHLDEPWDSPHNKTLIPLMPPIYRNPSSTAQPEMADYLAVVGEGLMFEGREGRRMSDIHDGTAHTIMVLEVDPDRAVVWTKPDDWEYDARNPMAGLGRIRPSGFNALFADSHLQTISRDISPNQFHAMLTIAGGEPFQPPSR